MLQYPLAEYMSLDKGLGRDELQEFRERDPEAFIRLVAGAFNLKVNAGRDPKFAWKEMVSQMIEERINLPLVVDLNPAAADACFDDLPEFDHHDIVDAELRIDRRT